MLKNSLVTTEHGNVQLNLHQLCVDINVYQDIWKPLIGEKLVAKREFDHPTRMDKHTVKVVLGH